MKLEERISANIKNGKIPPLPSTFQGVDKERISQVLAKIDRSRPDIIDVVFALLDDVLPSFFTKTANQFKFCAGASTAHIACHVGIIQRSSGKLDREGRDYWLKPLWEIGALEKVYFSPKENKFLPGHPTAKSPNSAYRIDEGFLKILKASPSSWQSILHAWSSSSAIRRRLSLQAKLAQRTRESVDSKHLRLIQDSQEHYVPNFLPGFEVIYIDDADGDRISDEESKKLERAGLNIALDDSMPDILLWNSTTDSVWVIEAVCSDGEVDWHKVENLTKLAKRCGKSSIGFTTTYPDWRTAATRQSSMKNLAVDTFLWIRTDGAKQFRVLPPVDFEK
ncbi:BsuBI/PstI family type II restriction endonuclease [Cerasicoccus maritimus]|uniref:BsuBI/PstI family type II restriction endonuclease n=1 Tax=Cerasicoccus maritimus TaxID=490089 RepID=UPI002852AA60|nr:BsuBI/PstI family type II restriction endonuclease [Cerasicoccus maritimus]